MKLKILIPIIVISGIILLWGGYFFVQDKGVESVENNDEVAIDHDGSAVNEDLAQEIRPQDIADAELVATRILQTTNIEGVDPAFEFTMEIEPGWEAEYIPESKAINIYDPDAEGETRLDKSQIFVKYFTASSFLTLTTVTIHAQEELEIADRPAVRYDIEKRLNVPDFSGQPSWRNERHFVTDIRSTDSSPTTFYVFGQNPTLSDERFNSLLESFNLGGELKSEEAAVIYPLREFTQRVTLKPFGLFVSPTNSPVSPERFSGYHTGIDAEAFETEENAEVPVFAIADGRIIEKQEVPGYGGVVIIEHIVDGEVYSALYGHLDIGSIEKNEGDPINKGEAFAFLGEGFTGETDGERKHLHFSIRTGTDTTLSGYVSSKSELSEWINPEEFFRDAGSVDS